MTTERKQGTVYPKQQLEIVKILEEKPYGQSGKSLLPIMAKNLSLPEGDPMKDKYQKHTVFNEELKTYIKPLEVGARFFADIEEHERPDSEYGPDRNIVQVYVNGEPVSKKKGGGNFGKSPDIVRLEYQLKAVLEAYERRSIEGQSAIAQVGNLLITAGKTTAEDLGLTDAELKGIKGKYWKAIEKSLDAFLVNTSPKIGSEPAGKPTSAPGKGQDKQGAAPKTDQVSTDPKKSEAVPFKNIGEVLTRATKLKPPVSRKELLDGLKVEDTSQIADLDAAWKVAEEVSWKKHEAASKQTKTESAAVKEAEELFK